MLIRSGRDRTKVAQLCRPARCCPFPSRVKTNKALPTCGFWQSDCMELIWNSMESSCVNNKHSQEHHTYSIAWWMKTGGSLVCSFMYYQWLCGNTHTVYIGQKITPPSVVLRPFKSSQIIFSLPLQTSSTRSPFPLGPLHFIILAIPFVISGHWLLTRRGGPVKQAWLNALCPSVFLTWAQRWWSLMSGSFISPVGTLAYCGSSVALRWLS